MKTWGNWTVQSFHILQIWIKRHCCPKKCVGNRCNCWQHLNDIQVRFRFLFFYFSFLCKSLDFSPGLFLCCTWCWNLLSRGWKYFLSEKEFSNYFQKNSTISKKQIQTLLILCSYIH